MKNAILLISISMWAIASINFYKGRKTTNTGELYYLVCFIASLIIAIISTAFYLFL